MVSGWDWTSDVESGASQRHAIITKDGEKGMRYIEFGNTGKRVSVIALGCMRMASLDVLKAEAVVKASLESGINFFDHADIYGAGKSEELFAQVLKRNPSLRDRIFIQSKCAIRSGLYDFSKRHILASVDGILRRLGVDHIDCLLLHRPDALMDLDEVSSAFSELKTSGKVCSFGVSNMNRFQMELLGCAIENNSSVIITANQLQLSLVHTPMIDEMFNVNTKFDGAIVRSSGTLEYCRMKDIIVQCWSPLQKGFFQGVFLGDPEYGKLNDVLNSLAEEYKVGPDAVAYAWLLRYPARMQVIVGTMSPDRIESASHAADFDLTREQWYELYRAAGNSLP